MDLGEHSIGVRDTVRVFIDLTARRFWACEHYIVRIEWNWLCRSLRELIKGATVGERADEMFRKLNVD